MIREPFGMFGKTFEMWTSLASDSVEKTATICAELDKADARNIEQLDGLVQEVAKLTKDTLTYQAALAAVWRKLTLESMSRFASFGAPASASSVRGSAAS